MRDSDNEGDDYSRSDDDTVERNGDRASSGDIPGTSTGTASSVTSQGGSSEPQKTPLTQTQSNDAQVQPRNGSPHSTS